MVFRMARPTRRQGSRFPYARKVVPKDLRDILGRSEFKRPLRGASEAENRRLHAAALAAWEAEIEAARAKARGEVCRLTAREVEAVCGAWYRAELVQHEHDIGWEEGWENHREALLDRVGDGPDDIFSPRPCDLAEAEQVLRSQGIAADADSITRTAERLWPAKLDFARTMIRRCRGDWEDPTLARFPAPVSAEPVAPEPLTFATLLAAWAKESQPAAGTLRLYLRIPMMSAGDSSLKSATHSD